MEIFNYYSYGSYPYIYHKLGFSLIFKVTVLLLNLNEFNQLKFSLNRDCNTSTWWIKKIAKMDTVDPICLQPISRMQIPHSIHRAPLKSLGSFLTEFNLSVVKCTLSLYTRTKCIHLHSHSNKMNIYVHLSWKYSCPKTLQLNPSVNAPIPMVSNGVERNPADWLFNWPR